MERKYIEKVLRVVLTFIIAFFAMMSCGYAAVKKPGVPLADFGKPAQQEVQESQNNSEKNDEPQNSEQKKEQKEEEQQNQKAEEFVPKSNNIVAAKVVKSSDELDAYSLESADLSLAYLAKAEVKHRDKFWFCSDSEEMLQQCIENMKEAKLKVITKLITKETQLPTGVFNVLSKPFGETTVYVVEIQIKDPNHQSWLQKNAGKILGLVGLGSGGIGGAITSILGTGILN